MSTAKDVTLTQAPETEKMVFDAPSIAREHGPLKWGDALAYASSLSPGEQPRWAGVTYNAVSWGAATAQFHARTIVWATAASGHFFLLRVSRSASARSAGGRTGENLI
eukprot:CAMPEP_0118929270 /NCGR_PEP_ID=MMETSP1169-20130426/6317_1 /TAXON_ID=36882 /ORGANISM="Pyramimonas obovata, Strain CCMP722" /LENGTH=107 /DNA_ID=CAMNT_0006871427 /DNA_START=68 /DNA_END=392 /DNA_ORIENTATION=+